LRFLTGRARDRWPCGDRRLHLDVSAAALVAFDCTSGAHPRSTAPSSSDSSPSLPARRFAGKQRVAAVYCRFSSSSCCRSPIRKFIYSAACWRIAAYHHKNDTLVISKQISLLKTHRHYVGLSDLLGFNGTFSTNRLYCAFEKYVAVKIVKLMRKLTMLHVGNTVHTICHYNK